MLSTLQTAVRRILHALIVLTFAVAPFWMRVPNAPKSFSIGYSFGFPLLWLMIAAIGLWLLTGCVGLGLLWRKRPPRLWMLAALGLAGWAFLSWAWAYTNQPQVGRPEVTISAAISFALSLIFAVVVASSAPPLGWVAAALMAGAVLNATSGGLQVAVQGSLGGAWLGELRLDPLRSGTSIVQVGNLRWLRPYGFLPHPNIMAGILVVGLYAATQLVLQQRRMVRLLGYAVSLSLLWVLLLSFSRSAWLGLALGGVAVVPLMWRWRKPLLVWAICAVMLTTAFALLYQPFLFARAGVGAESVEQRSLSDRTVFNQIAIDSIRQSPVLGWGLGNFAWIAAHEVAQRGYDLRGQPVHLVYLSIWSELGLVGLGLFALFLYIPIRQVWVRRQQSDAENLSVFLLAAVIAWAVIGWLDHYPITLLQGQVWWFGLMGALVKSD